MSNRLLSAAVLALGFQLPFAARVAKKKAKLNATRVDPDYDCDLDGQNDCRSWNYWGARCDNGDVCEYRYRFGDTLLDHSCRCKSPVTHYDCNGDGVDDCGSWNYPTAQCNYRHTCEYQYQFGDSLLDQSCRCKPECLGADKNCEPEPSEYDCDGDGTHDCGAWSYSTAQCENLQYCKYEYKFGDGLLDQSCRCRQCTVRGGASEVIDADLGGTTFWNMWNNWGDHIDTCAPWMMPQNDADLQQLLAYAASKNYIVRPSGASHSAGPLVDDGNDERVFVVSLGQYEAPGEWQYSLDTSAKKVKVNAGWSQLDLYEKIRPLDLFLPSQTAGYFFQLGGVVANTVHGATYDKSFIHSYVTSMRVMLHDGTIKIVTGDDLKYWRNSYGLLGLILGIEFQLTENRQFQMISKSRTAAWSEAEFWKFIMEDGEANLDASASKGLASGSRKSSAGEFFIDLLPDEPSFLVYANKENENAVEPGYPNGKPANITAGYAELRARMTRTRENPVYDPDRPEKIPYSDSIRREGCPPYYLSIGDFEIIDINKLIGGKLISTIAQVIDPLRFAAQTIREQPTLVAANRDISNDGFFAIEAPNTNIAAYFMKPEKAFEAMDFLRQRMIARNGQATWNRAEGFSWNQPAEFRFMTVTDDAVLQPVPPGVWFVSEILAFPDAAHTDQAWKEAFKEIEDYWITNLGAIPHIGKLFGFVQEESGQYQVFHQDRVCSVYSSATKEAFESYRRATDPAGRFNYGLGSRLLQSC